MGNLDSQDSPWPELGGSHHLPPDNILCASPRGRHPNGFFVLGLPSGNPEIAKINTLVTLGAHNFACKPLIEMRFEVGKSGRFPTFNGWESNYQFDSRPLFWP